MPTVWQWIAGGVVLYLLLLARSAWKQGEFKQFLWGLVTVIGLLTLIGGIIWIWDAARGP